MDERTAGRRVSRVRTNVCGGDGGKTDEEGTHVDNSRPSD